MKKPPAVGCRRKHGNTYDMPSELSDLLRVIGYTLTEKRRLGYFRAPKEERMNGLTIAMWMQKSLRCDLLLLGFSEYYNCRLDVRSDRSPDVTTQASIKYTVLFSRWRSAWLTSSHTILTRRKYLELIIRLLFKLSLHLLTKRIRGAGF